MSFDLFQSRRNYNEPCKWWSRDERDELESNELIMKRIPSGTFWAKEVSPESLQNIQIGNTFMFDKTNITIKTPDNIFGLKNNDVVLFRDELWIVINVQKTKARMQQTQFAIEKNCSHYWYIELRK